MLVARRDALLAELGRAISQEFDVQYRVLAMDLSQEGFHRRDLPTLRNDLDIGLVVSNAGTANPGEFLKLDRGLFRRLLRLNTRRISTSLITSAETRQAAQGGLLLVGAMGADNGRPCMANDGAAKAYVQSFSDALHVEFKPLGVYVTVLGSRVYAHRGARKVRLQSEDHAAETDERRAVRI